MSRENPVALFLCGLACTAKSTTLHTIAKKHKVNVLFNDYYELSQQHPEFLKKHEDPGIQVLYTINQTIKSIVTKPTVFDRSPLSDFLYSLIYDEQDQAGAGTEKLKRKLNWKLFTETCVQFKTAYVIIGDDDLQARQDILHKMKTRNNGIDTISENYIVAQQKIFKLISENIPNYTALIKPKHIPIHTREYYKWLEEKVENFLRENHII